VAKVASQLDHQQIDSLRWNTSLGSAPVVEGVGVDGPKLPPVDHGVVAVLLVLLASVCRPQERSLSKCILAVVAKGTSVEIAA
jgi:hypothetical protein